MKVFGRGGEEILAYSAHGIHNVEYVPGITSSVSAPGLAGIPVTQRGYADRFVVCTATGRADGNPDLPPYNANQTVIFLMGARRLAGLCESLIKMGYPHDLPAAVICKASWPNQAVARADLATLASAAERAGARAPCTIVVGRVVEAHLDGLNERGRQIFSAPANKSTDGVVTAVAPTEVPAKRPTHDPTFILFDNGSLRAAATVSLRKVASALEAAPGMPFGSRVIPASARFSTRVDPSELDGVPAELAHEVLARITAEGTESDVILLPFFIGPADTAVKFVPGKAPDFPGLNVRVAPPLVSPHDDRVARALQSRVEEVVRKAGIDPIDGEYSVLLCDHGSPSASVGVARDTVSVQLAALIGRTVTGCAMERRDGPEYDFNNPMLEDLIRTLPVDASPVVIALLFLGPGKHAGAGGDIAEIIDKALAIRNGNLGVTAQVLVAEVLGDHPLIISTLVDRAKAAVDVGWLKNHVDAHGGTGAGGKCTVVGTRLRPSNGDDSEGRSF